MKFLEQLSKYELTRIILEERIDNGNATICMARCPYGIGEEQKQCSKFKIMEDYEEGELFYCTHSAIQNGKAFCEISIK